MELSQNNDSNETLNLRQWMAEIEADHKEREITANLPYPWRRYFARVIDLSIYGLIWVSVYSLVFRWQSSSTSNIFFTLLNNYITYGLMLLFEPLFLSFWGTTPGKWILGLVIRNEDGSKLSYAQAWERTRIVFGKGMGYGIPIYIIVREVKSYNTCNAAETLDWEEDLTYSLKDEKLIRIFGCIVLFILLNALDFYIILQS